MDKKIVYVSKNEHFFGNIGADAGRGYKVGDVVFLNLYDKYKTGIIVQEKNSKPFIMGWGATNIFDNNSFTIIGKVMDCKYLTNEYLKTFCGYFELRDIETISLEEAESLLGKKILV